MASTSDLDRAVRQVVELHARVHVAAAGRRRLVEHRLERGVRHRADEVEVRAERAEAVDLLRRDVIRADVAEAEAERGPALQRRAGRARAGGAVSGTLKTVRSSEAPRISSRDAASTSAVRDPSKAIRPPSTSPTRCARKVKLVTTPKLPPPPRSAQNRSGSASAETCRTRPSAVTTSAPTQVVDRQPVPAHQPALAAAEREAGEARVADGAGGDGEAEALRLAVELAEAQAGAGDDDAALGVDGDPLERGEVEHDAAVADAEARHAVPAAAHGERQSAVAGGGEHGHDVVGVATARDDGGAAVDRAVEDGARVVVAAVAGDDDVAAHAAAQAARRGGRATGGG